MTSALDSFRNPPSVENLDITPQYIPTLFDTQNSDVTGNRFFANVLNVRQDISSGRNLIATQTVITNNVALVDSNGANATYLQWINGANGVAILIGAPSNDTYIQQRLYFAADNQFDIGQYQGNRPRTIYAANSIIVGSSNSGGPAGFIYFQHPSGSNTSTLAQYNSGSGLIIIGGSNVPNVRLAYSGASGGGIPAFQAGDHYVVANATGDIHLSSLGPAS